MQVSPLAYPTVPSVTETAFDTAATTHLVSMPATVDVNDLLIALFAVAHSGMGAPATVTTPSGWTLLGMGMLEGGPTPSEDIRFAVYYKKATGTEDGTTVDFVTSSSARAAAQVYRISASSWDNTTAPAISSAGTGLTNTPDPPPLNPGAWDVEETLWIVAAGVAVNTGITSYPSDYGGGVTTGSGASTPNCQVSSARRENEVALEDPGTFNLPGSTTYRWVAFTIAVRPAANQAPVADPQSGLTVNSCSTLTVTLTGTDSDGDPLTYKISTLPLHGDLYDGTGTGGTHITSVPYTVTDGTHKVTYQPDSSYSGADSFGFKVHDGTVDSTEATISMTVSDSRTTYYHDADGDGVTDNSDTQDACSDPDGPGTEWVDTASPVTDCDDSNANCTTDCTDVDSDGYCVTHDCDDSAGSCTTDCVTDVDTDGTPDCKDTCIDPDGDGYGVGPGCTGTDCDETSTSCNMDCVTDVDTDGTPDCKDTCIDPDGDGYGVGPGCTGSDCDESSASCNTD